MARGIDSDFLEPFPTVLEIPGVANDPGALREFFVAHLQQPSFVSRAIVTPSPTGELSSVLFVFVFGLALEYSRHWQGMTVREKTFCCGSHTTVSNGQEVCGSCNTPWATRFAPKTLTRDPEPTVDEDGHSVQEENASMIQFEEHLAEAFDALGIDPLNGTLIGSEVLTLSHSLVHSSL